jgi:hypothetical protein
VRMARALDTTTRHTLTVRDVEQLLAKPTSRDGRAVALAPPWTNQPWRCFSASTITLNAGEF